MWEELYSDRPSSLYQDEFLIFSPKICQTPWKTRRLRIELDTCGVSGWNQIAAVRLIGTETVRWVEDGGWGMEDEG
jgi:hypothetical protein